MARTPENENITRNREFVTDSEANQAYNNASSDIGAFNRNEATLARGGEVGANPYLSPSYLANVNKEQANSLDAATNAGKTALLDANRRAGGGNTGATTGAITGLTLQKARLANNLSANRTESDYGKNLSWQQYLAGAPLQAAGAETSLYGPALNANASYNADLTKYGLAQQQQWYKELSDLEQAGKAAASAGLGGAGLGGSLSAGLEA